MERSKFVNDFEQHQESRETARIIRFEIRILAPIFKFYVHTASIFHISQETFYFYEVSPYLTSS
ncbi:hypothetical protein CQ052_10825 [Ochrobactrum sp. MYb15]|nr:hypothetical protein CQZ90_10070 [Ochrobactrum sp. MYb19]PRA67288.1 hypothetical protein CQ053_08260 [Ochrobactrum sp. MYb18]PRA77753.1 hypothetical protein CQ049_10825 [Brucella thiophenivorans]PRA92298.1 hypothetical protein CQ051_09270 [Ochrobactrum sp. MYb14]PRA99763.1 hypothetical protein CQ052_10825 [Ochrobactrum sp. MYb15]